MAKIRPRSYYIKDRAISKILATSLKDTGIDLVRWITKAMQRQCVCKEMYQPPSFSPNILSRPLGVSSQLNIWNLTPKANFPLPFCFKDGGVHCMLMMVKWNFQKGKLFKIKKKKEKSTVIFSVMVCCFLWNLEKFSSPTN